MVYQWYPGHMTKARRAMQEDIKLIDLIIELVDARCPQSSRNPDIDEMGKNKARLILLNKSDLSDPAANRAWTAYFESLGFAVLEINARSGAGMKAIQGKVQEACREKIERDRKRGILNRPVRAMVAGIPNVGKSTFINSFAGKACAKTGNKPGVTKGKQWIRLNKGLELLDTPGILWPKFEDSSVGVRLAFTGAIRDEVVDIEELAMRLMDYLGKNYPKAIEERYKLTVSEEDDGYALLEKAGRKRGFLISGGEVDTERMAKILLDEYRAVSCSTSSAAASSAALRSNSRRRASAHERQPTLRGQSPLRGLFIRLRRGRGGRGAADGPCVRRRRHPAGGL